MAITDKHGSIFWLLEVVEGIACHCLVWETIATLTEGHGYVRTCAEIDMCPYQPEFLACAPGRCGLCPSGSHGAGAENMRWYT